MKILVLNAGSSSLKSSLYDVGDALSDHPPVPAWGGRIEWDGGHGEVQVENSQGANLKDRIKVESRPLAMEHLLDTLWSGKASVVSGPSEINIVGHRIVH